MEDAESERGLVASRGVMLIDDFARATGLVRQAADALVTDRRVEGLHHSDGRVFGIFDDALPTREQLQSWGLDVRDDYDPERHRSYSADADDGPDPAPDADAGESESAGWTMSWDHNQS